jgi:hypothetical protein
MTSPPRPDRRRFRYRQSTAEDFDWIMSIGREAHALAAAQRGDTTKLCQLLRAGTLSARRQSELADLFERWQHLIPKLDAATAAALERHIEVLVRKRERQARARNGGRLPRDGRQLLNEVLAELGSAGELQDGPGKRQRILARLERGKADQPDKSTGSRPVSATRRRTPAGREAQALGGDTTKLCQLLRAGTLSDQWQSILADLIERWQHLIPKLDAVAAAERYIEWLVRKFEEIFRAGNGGTLYRGTRHLILDYVIDELELAGELQEGPGELRQTELGENFMVHFADGRRPERWYCGPQKLVFKYLPIQRERILGRLEHRSWPGKRGGKNFHAAPPSKRARPSSWVSPNVP